MLTYSANYYHSDKKKSQSLPKICIKNTNNIDQAGALFQSTDAPEKWHKQHHHSDDNDEGGWREEVVLQEEGDIVVDRVDGSPHGDYEGWCELEDWEKINESFRILENNRYISSSSVRIFLHWIYTFPYLFQSEFGVPRLYRWPWPATFLMLSVHRSFAWCPVVYLTAHAVSHLLLLQ